MRYTEIMIPSALPRLTRNRFYSLVLGDVSVLADLNPNALNSQTLLMEQGQSVVAELWAHPGADAWTALQALIEQGQAFNARGEQGLQGLMQLASVPWGNETWPVAQALERVDQWRSMGGSLNDLVDGQSVLGMMVENNGAHLSAMLDRGADPGAGEMALPLVLARRGQAETVIDLLQQGVALDWLVQDSWNPDMGVFRQMLPSLLKTWEPTHGACCLQRVVAFTEAWATHGPGLWAGRITAGKQAPLSACEVMGDPETVRDWLCGHENEVVSNFKQITTPFLDMAFEQAWAIHERNPSDVRGLWLAWLTHDVARTEAWVKTSPHGLSATMPLDLKRPDGSNLDLCDSWLATFRKGCDVFQSPPCSDRDLTGLHWMAAAKLAREQGLDLPGEWLAHQRTVRAGEIVDPVHVSRRSPRARC